MSSKIRISYIHLYTLISLYISSDGSIKKSPVYLLCTSAWQSCLYNEIREIFNKLKVNELVKNKKNKQGISCHARCPDVSLNLATSVKTVWLWWVECWASANISHVVISSPFPPALYESETSPEVKDRGINSVSIKHARLCTDPGPEQAFHFLLVSIHSGCFSFWQCDGVSWKAAPHGPRWAAGEIREKLLSLACCCILAFVLNWVVLQFVIKSTYVTPHVIKAVLEPMCPPCFCLLRQTATKNVLKALRSPFQNIKVSKWFWNAKKKNVSNCYNWIKWYRWLQLPTWWKEKRTSTTTPYSSTHTQAYPEIYALINTHTHSERVLPHRGCEGDVSATRTISILITLTPRTASTHIRPLLHYVPSLPPSIPHPFSTLLFSLVSVWVSQSASSSSCWYMLAALTLSLKHTHRCAHTHAHASEQMSFLHTLLLIAPLLTHHLLFILRWVHTGCPRQPSIYIVIERGGDKSMGEGRGRQEGPIESCSYDCFLCTASSSQTPTLFTYLFIFLLSNRVASSYLSVFIPERVYKTSNKKLNW